MPGERFVPDALEPETGDVVACGLCSNTAPRAWWNERPQTVLWFADVLLDRMLTFARARGLGRLAAIDPQRRTRFRRDEATELAMELAVVQRECGDLLTSECAQRILVRVGGLLAGPNTDELNIEGP
jgi:hypothetical protein